MAQWPTPILLGKVMIVSGVGEPDETAESGPIPDGGGPSGTGSYPTAGWSTPIRVSIRVTTATPTMLPYMIHLWARSPRAVGACCSDMGRPPSNVAAARVALGGGPKAIGRLELV